ncbi:MAG: phage terminase large subunit family protein [Planctomycetaceae bacterium]|nr:phage terminase large subunit family protein [Planctomycetaceae bacterium]
MRDSQKTLQHATGGAGLEASIYSALERLTDERLNHVYFRDDGTEMRVERCLIDSNWGQSTDVIYQFCRQSKHAAVLFPSHGQYVGASSIPFAEHKRQKGDSIGHHWRIPDNSGARAVRHVMIDTNFWKTFVHAQLGILMGDAGCLSMFGHEPKRHRLLAEHITAEYRVRTMAYSQTVDEWKNRVSRPDNHWLDCLVGCAVGASIQGAELTTFQSKPIIARPRIRLSELQRRRQ